MIEMMNLTISLIVNERRNGILSILEGQKFLKLSAGYFTKLKFTKYGKIMHYLY
jgi:hypothetical protein